METDKRETLSNEAYQKAFSLFLSELLQKEPPSNQDKKPREFFLFLGAWEEAEEGR